MGELDLPLWGLGGNGEETSSPSSSFSPLATHHSCGSYLFLADRLKFLTCLG